MRSILHIIKGGKTKNYFILISLKLNYQKARSFYIDNFFDNFRKDNKGPKYHTVKLDRVETR